MRLIFIYSILSLISYFSGTKVFASDHIHEISIDDNNVLTVIEIAGSRLLPHAYYDQAIASIPALYPEHEFLAKRRFAYIGKVAYSIVCYKKDKDDNIVIISGTAVLNTEAWSFQAEVPEPVFGDALIIVLETISKIPDNLSE